MKATTLSLVTIALVLSGCNSGAKSWLKALENSAAFKVIYKAHFIWGFYLN